MPTLEFMMLIRKIDHIDLKEIEELANNTYPDNFFESAESFSSKILGFPDGCFVCEVDKKLVGYVVSFPSRINFVEPLNKIYKKCENANCHYIHDVCVNSNFRKMGVANNLLKKIFDKFFVDFALVAVMGSASFWQKFGFEVVQQIDYYNSQAHYMVKKHG